MPRRRVQRHSGTAIRSYSQRPKPRIVSLIQGGDGYSATRPEIDTLGEFVAKPHGCTVALSIYRKAPEHPYPAPLTTVACRCRGSRAHADELSETGAPLIVGGRAPGQPRGCLRPFGRAMRAGPELNLQLVVLLRRGRSSSITPSYLDDSNQLTLTRSGMRWFWITTLPRIDGH